MTSERKALVTNMFNHLSNSSTKSGVLGVPGTGTERILGGCWGSGSLFPSFSVWVANDFKFRPLNANCSADKRLGVGGEYQFSSVAQSCPTLCDPMECSTPGFPVHHQLPESTKSMPIESVMPPNHLILGHPLLLLPSIFPSIRVFSNQSALRIRWPKYWSFSFSISPSNEHPGLIFRMDWLDLLAVQGTFKSSPTPQFKSINSLVLSFLYSPTLTSIHDYLKNHSLD